MNNPDTYLQFHQEDAPVQHIALLSADNDQSNGSNFFRQGFASHMWTRLAKFPA